MPRANAVYITSERMLRNNAIQAFAAFSMPDDRTKFALVRIERDGGGSYIQLMKHNPGQDPEIVGDILKHAESIQFMEGKMPPDYQLVGAAAAIEFVNTMESLVVREALSRVVSSNEESKTGTWVPPEVCPF